MGVGRGSLETIKRASRTVLFMIIMLGSLLLSSAPLLVSLVDVISPCLILSTFSCCLSCFGLKQDWATYSFRTSLIDIPLLSLARSLLIVCAYSLGGLPTLTYGPYLATAATCGFMSAIFLILKASFFALPFDGAPLLPVLRPLYLKHSWRIRCLLLSSMLLALGHTFVAYRTRCQARRKLHFYRLDQEAVVVCKVALNGGYQKLPQSLSIAHSVKTNKATLVDGKIYIDDERDLPATMLAEYDSLFMFCEGLVVHYKMCVGSSIVTQDASEKEFASNAVGEHTQNGSKRSNVTLQAFLKEKRLGRGSGTLYSPLLDSTNTCSRDAYIKWPLSNEKGLVLHSPLTGEGNLPSKAIIFIHGFAGGVFSWRHVMHPLAVQMGCTVAAFDRPGWGLTSRPVRADWERKHSKNPYELQSQVDLLVCFCMELKVTSVVLVGHDDGGLLALMAAARFRAIKDTQVEVKGIVLVGVSLSREVVPAFARVLLHTSLGRHMLRPLLRSEIGQVANRQAWHDASKLTSDIMDLYKAPLRVEGWDEALAEVSRASTGSILSSNDATALLNSMHDLPALVVTGMDDILAPLKSAQALALQLPLSRLIPIPSCGHLPHEESPGALLAALVPFITSLRVENSTTFL